MKHEINYATTDLDIRASFDLTIVADQLVERGLTFCKLPNRKLEPITS